MTASRTDALLTALAYLAALNGRDECVEWSGALDTNGYGRASVRDPLTGHFVEGRAHRVVWVASGRTLDVDLQLDHLCRNRACVNPAHLEQVTAYENGIRGVIARHGYDPRTHCASGHRRTEANTYRTGAPSGRCRDCNREAARRYKARRAAAVSS
ncbi:HNH endonuclease [uncultured Jatrophihabitans sp.]|uniref:HNH endonuclease n=1 Tax=uncultured Jatrophihabitans sp. TaxID=1610747 RepID=UPI0035CB4C5A